MPWLIETEVAPTTSHLRVADCPTSILIGLTLKRTMKGRFDGVDTVTVTDAVAEPKELVAVST